MQIPFTHAMLTPAWKRLLRLFQKVNFGRVKRVVVRNGEPVFDPRPQVVRDIKFGGDNVSRPESVSVDYSLKPQVRELIEQLARLGDGVVKVIEVKHGLPFLMRVVESAD
jgi:hypothetical protein